MFYAGLLCGGLVGATNHAQAYPTSWEFNGTITERAGAWPDDLAIGTPFRVIVSFDTEEAISSQPSYSDPVTGVVSGKRFNYWGPRSLKFTVYAGTTCNPCVPSNDPGFNPDENLIIVRDNFPGDTGNGTPVIQTDGISFGTRTVDGLGISVILRDAYDRFSTPVVNVDWASPKPLPVEPDPRLVQMVVSIFQICQTANECLNARLDSVTIPSYGTYYFLSGRHCLYADQLWNGSHGDFYGDDCVADNRGQPLVRQVGGGAGVRDFTETATFSFATPDPGDAPGATDPLGTVFGAVEFSGPGGLPILRGSSFPSAVGRTNANLLAYQQYNFAGPNDTPLALVVNLGYQVYSNWTLKDYPAGNTSPREIEVGLRPGGASMGAVLSVVDAKLVPPVAMAALQTFNSLVCGAEAEKDASGNYLHKLPNGQPFPPGSIRGTGVYRGGDLEQYTDPANPRIAQFAVYACDGANVSGSPIRMQNGDSLYLTASMQTPARGLKSQDGAADAAANGFVDAANTVRVVPDPAAPPEVQQALAQGLAPACTDCEFTPELVIDVKPGSTDNPINPALEGSIPVALLGSDRFNVRDVDASTLRLGSLVPRVNKNGAIACSVTAVNADELEDLVCHFVNRASNWQANQTLVTLTGKLKNGEGIFASDAVRVLR